MVSVTDTHSLVWYLTGKCGRLGKKALKQFQEAESSRGHIVIPAVAIFELVLLVESGKLEFPDIRGFIRDLKRASNFSVADLTIEIIEKAMELAAIGDPFDRLIAATAKALDYPLISRDEKLGRLDKVETIWD